MLIGRIPGATRFLGAPANWNEQTDTHCAVLPILDYDVDGNNVMASAWEPTPDEIAAIVAGAKVHLHIWGSGHPVVAMTVGQPPSDEGAAP